MTDDFKRICSEALHEFLPAGWSSMVFQGATLHGVHQLDGLPRYGGPVEGIIPTWTSSVDTISSEVTCDDGLDATRRMRFICRELASRIAEGAAGRQVILDPDVDFHFDARVARATAKLCFVPHPMAPHRELPNVVASEEPRGVTLQDFLDYAGSLDEPFVEDEEWWLL